MTSQLSRREAEILWLYADGLSSKQVAAKLGISFNTVHATRRHFMVKLGAETIAHAVHKGHLLGVLR